MRTCVAVLLLLAAACDGSGPDTPAEAPVVRAGEESGDYSPERVPGGVAITALGDLVGEYRVAGIDDQPLDMPQGIALSVDGPLLSFEPVCAGFVWEVQFDSEQLSLTRTREPEPPVAEGVLPPPPRTTCAIGILPEWDQLATALDAASRAERTPANAVRISGGGHSVTLFSQ